MDVKLPDSGDFLFYFVCLQVARQREFCDTNLRLYSVALVNRKRGIRELITQFLRPVLKAQEMLV
jgi:hypothetical protein